MKERPNILVVCGRNKRRSRTAEHIFKNDQRFSIRSVGLSPKSERQIKERDIDWADLIFVMEDSQSRRITGAFRHMELPEIEVLHIEDEYEYLDTELIEMLTDRINSTLRVIWEL
ncbi:protein-tyrosine-phosphatase [Algoriphagus sp. D3-2-R+10]|uniref:protein-tyrosine-phosphatase n=1 Tax=Algoriphagus aurantiacus TaxID=3103948 RepID=UPI002B389434|nr:protein-tyrosine-phosphatase [Algoriphagus sp. D3-2-R+10]MEB2777949.1 protein-tyrosine-phosphatase [Algoriphagus sp. D3-2-R+10]